MTKSHSSFFRNTAWQYGLQLVKYLFPLFILPYLRWNDNYFKQENSF